MKLVCVVRNQIDSYVFLQVAVAWTQIANVDQSMKFEYSGNFHWWVQCPDGICCVVTTDISPLWFFGQLDKQQAASCDVRKIEWLVR